MDILHSVLKAVSGLTLSGLFQLLLTFVLGLIAVKYIVRLFARVLSRTTLDPSVQALVVNAGRGLLWFLLILILAPQLGIQVTSLITLLGVFGVAISLALQNSLSNVAGGISVLVSKPFSTGDFIEVTGGASGTVDSVGLFHTEAALPAQSTRSGFFTPSSRRWIITAFISPTACSRPIRSSTIQSRLSAGSK